MITWMLIGWPVLGAFGCVAWVSRQPASAETKALEDAEQAAYLAEWNAAQIAYKHRYARKDRRGQHDAADRVRDALHAKLRAEVGR